MATIARALLAGLALWLVAIAAHAQPFINGAYTYQFTTAAEINAQTIDTSQAGTALPAWAKAGTLVFSDTFNQGATCPEIGDEVQTVNGQVTPYTEYTETVAEGGNAGTQFVNKATLLADGLMTCANGYLQMTIANIAGTWTGPRIKTHSYGDPVATNGMIHYGYWEIQAQLPAVDGVTIPTPPTPSPWWIANWTITKPLLVAYQTWFEGDNPETGVQSNPANIAQDTGDFHTANSPYPAQLQTPPSSILVSAGVPQALFTGAPFTLGELTTPNYYTAYLNGVELWRINISAMGDDIRNIPWHMLIEDVGLHDPTNTAYSVTENVYYMKGWSAPAGSCPYLKTC